MYYNKRRTNEHSSLKLMLFMIICLALVVVVLFTNMRTALIKDSYLYIKAIEKSIPYFGTNVQATNDKGVKSESFRDLIYDKITNDLMNPSNLLAEEIPYFNSTSGNEKEYNENYASINPFSLSDGAIAKLNPEEKQSTNQQGDSGTPIKVSAAFDPKLKKQLNESKPEVLIYHTHTTEAYKPANADSTEEKYSVVGVGTALEKELENYGISVIHDKTMHSMVYNDSYLRSAETVKKYLGKYNNFKLIIDLHRDSTENKNATTLNINGENVAKIMFVTAQNTPYYDQNNGITESLNDISRKLFPGFSKGILSYRRGMNSFNQNLSNHSILIEVGSDINTSDESQGSAKYVARVIAEYLNKK
ncbi:stage II sporulation protein P [Clostridium sp. C8-1-8]|uniref:stage II sporulation protein P n=1 Tax=Clostridium sp. C8-1-8 TaxID=2698831 RepID=UPI0013687EF6|nr:stage II sporulation protein P [Clostridium sp. C8-1-8]